MKKANNHKPTITIIGAGLGGVFLAILFAKRDYPVRIYERYSEKEIFDNSSRRSFNITFFGYGVAALKEVGLWEEIQPALLRMTGSATQITPYSEYTVEHLNEKEMPYYAVSRSGLLQSLIMVAKRYKNITWKFDTKLVSVDRYTKKMTIQNKVGSIKTFPCDVIFGTDGVNSTIRSAVQQNQTTHHSQEFAPWTYKQVMFSAKMMKEIGMNSQMAYSWTRKQTAIMGFPQVNGTFCALLMLPKNKKQGFNTLQSEAAIKRFITKQFPILIPALQNITHGVLTNPEGNFVTIRTSPWYYKDFLALAGDAAHGCLPFYGMGTSIAFGDGMELMKLVDKYGPDWGKIFPLYQEERKKNTDVIANLSEQSLERFTRFSKANRNAIFDKLEDVLSARFPKLFLPSVFKLVVSDPNRSWELFKKHENQRKIVTYLGLSLAVTCVTVVVAMKEKMSRGLSSLDMKDMLRLFPRVN